VLHISQNILRIFIKIFHYYIKLYHIRKNEVINIKFKIMLIILVNILIHKHIYIFIIYILYKSKIFSFYNIKNIYSKYLTQINKK